MRKKQQEFNLDKGKHGGRRFGSGRKRIHSKGVAHRKREKTSNRTPMHINFKYKVLIKNKHCLKILRGAIINARRLGLRVVHFSLQTNHIHLVVEAADNETLTRGMRSLTVTFAKRVGKGRIQMERYHLHVLKSLRETRNALYYVLFNEQRHRAGRISRIDGYSSLQVLPQAMKMIRKFVIKTNTLVIIGKKDNYQELSKEESFLLMKASS